jgi:integrase
VFYRIIWVAGRQDWSSLRTRSLAEAQERGETLLRALLEAGGPREQPPLTLGELWERYQQEAPGYRENARSTQQGKQLQARAVIAFFGASKRVEDLCPNDVARYTQARRSRKRHQSGGVRRRTVHADLVFLRTMLVWATTLKLPSGEWLLAENPLRGVRFPREQNPRRPIATFDRFERVRLTIRRLASEATSNLERGRWLRLELALVFAEGTGRRIGSIRRLRWSDISYDPPAILWRAEFDKRHREQLVPIPESLAAEIRAVRARLGSVGDGWVFRQATKDAPWAPAQCQDYLRQAEASAGVEKLEGGLWHAYRRKWATERKDLPLKDVAAAGGWKDVTTLLMCYQHADEATMLRVMASPTKLVSRRTAGEVEKR